jgi:hypothetical protein
MEVKKEEIRKHAIVPRSMTGEMSDERRYNMAPRWKWRVTVSVILVVAAIAFNVWYDVYRADIEAKQSINMLKADGKEYAENRFVVEGNVKTAVNIITLTAMLLVWASFIYPYYRYITTSRAEPTRPISLTQKPKGGKD